MNSASQAALAALQMHSKPTSAAPKPTSRGGQVNRSNSLSNYGRSNSMRTYSYTPSASYQAGPPKPTGRSNSMQSHGMHSGLTRPPRPQLYQGNEGIQETEDLLDTESVVITTKTTKVLDSMGRTKSITTETIRTMPDGSNIIETKTTNISRPTLRSNSLRNNSLSVGGAGYNLDKIDEDLQDFDYTYLDLGHVPPRLNEVPLSPRHQTYIQEQRHALSQAGHVPPLSQAQSLARNLTPTVLSPANQLPQANPTQLPTSHLNAQLHPNQLSPTQDHLSPDRLASLTSTQSARRLKSILKNSAGHGFSNPEDEDKGNMQSPNRLGPAISLSRDAPSSMASGGASIKFRETVETISYPAESHNLAAILREESLKKEEELKKNVDLYSQAMKVAMEKVYGPADKADLQTPPDSPATEPRKELGSLVEKKLKNDHKRERVESAGVSKNYIYENHHRNFAVRSMRDSSADPHSTRKERAKEEKRVMKEEEKRNTEILKNAEKERKKEEKLQKKREKKSFSLFGRKKRRDSIDTPSGVEILESRDYMSPVAPTQRADVSPQAPKYGSPQQEQRVASQIEPLQIQPSHAVSQQVPSPTLEQAAVPVVSLPVESHEPVVLEVASSNMASTADFVDVPDYIDEDHEPHRMNAIFPAASGAAVPEVMSALKSEEKESEIPSPDLASGGVPEAEPKSHVFDNIEVPPRGDLTQLNDSDVPPRGDLAELNEFDVPPRADLQVLNSPLVSLQPISEDMLPTLVVGLNNHPQVIMENVGSGSVVPEVAERSDVLNVEENNADEPGDIPVIPESAQSVSHDVTGSEAIQSATLDPRVLPVADPAPQSDVVTNLPESNLSGPSLPELNMREPNLENVPTEAVKSSSFPSKIIKPQLAHVDDVPFEAGSLLEDDEDSTELNETASQRSDPHIAPSEGAESEPASTNVQGSALSEESERTLRSAEKGDHVTPEKVDGAHTNEAVVTDVVHEIPVPEVVESENRTESEMLLKSDAVLASPAAVANGARDSENTVTTSGPQPVSEAENVVHSTGEKEEPKILPQVHEDVVPEVGQPIAEAENENEPLGYVSNTESGIEAARKYSTTSERQSETSNKGKMKKRGLRFKKMIDKYFINSYSR